MRLLVCLEQISACYYAVTEVFGLVFRMLLCGCWCVWNRFQRVAMRFSEVFGLVFRMLLCGC